jgi:hypothetical protein
VSESAILRVTDPDGAVSYDPSKEALLESLRNLRSPQDFLLVEPLVGARRGAWAKVTLNEHGLYVFRSSDNIRDTTSLRLIHDLLFGWAYDVPLAPRARRRKPIKLGRWRVSRPWFRAVLLLAFVALLEISPNSWGLRKGSWFLTGILSLGVVLLVFVRGWRDGGRRGSEPYTANKDTGESEQEHAPHQ